MLAKGLLFYWMVLADVIRRNAKQFCFVTGEMGLEKGFEMLAGENGNKAMQ